MKYFSEVDQTNKKFDEFQIFLWTLRGIKLKQSVESGDK